MTGWCLKILGEVHSCRNHKADEPYHEAVMISEQQEGFMPRKSSSGVMFALRMVTETYREGLESCPVFVGRG